MLATQQYYSASSRITFVMIPLEEPISGYFDILVCALEWELGAKGLIESTASRDWAMMQVDNLLVKVMDKAGVSVKAQVKIVGLGYWKER